MAGALGRGYWWPELLATNTCEPVILSSVIIGHLSSLVRQDLNVAQVEDRTGGDIRLPPPLTFPSHTS